MSILVNSNLYQGLEIVKSRVHTQKPHQLLLQNEEECKTINLKISHKNESVKPECEL